MLQISYIYEQEQERERSCFVNVCVAYFVYINRTTLHVTREEDTGQLQDRSFSDTTGLSGAVHDSC